MSRYAGFYRAPTRLVPTWQELQPEDLLLTDIAIALARQPRWNGQGDHGRVSIAEHSYWVSKMVDPSIAREALFHDAEEALTGDLHGLLKKELPNFERIARHVKNCVRTRFGLMQAEPLEIHHRDMQIREPEAAAIFDGRFVPFQLKDPHDGRMVATIEMWDEDCARRMFLDRALELEVEYAA